MPGNNKVFTTILTFANTWYEVASNISNYGDIIGWTIKSHEDTPEEFEFSLTSDYSEIISNSGQGHTEHFPINNIYARSTLTGTKIELIIWWN